MISVLQVHDVIVNKPFKDCLFHPCGEWLLSGTCPLTPVRYLTLGEWIRTVHKGLSFESNVYRLQKCCMSSIMDGNRRRYQVSRSCRQVIE
jgi:hypothetical protein